MDAQTLTNSATTPTAGTPASKRFKDKAKTPPSMRKTVEVAAEQLAVVLYCKVHLQTTAACVLRGLAQRLVRGRVGWPGVVRQIVSSSARKEKEGVRPAQENSAAAGN